MAMRIDQAWHQDDITQILSVTAQVAPFTNLSNPGLLHAYRAIDNGRT
jgi:hypothetical protein